MLGIDLSPIVPLEGVLTMIADFSDGIRSGRWDHSSESSMCVLSDASPKLSGHRSYDQARSIALGEEALSFACDVLKPGGNFVVKSFQGEDFNHLLERVRDHFLSVRTSTGARTTRKGSSEVYVIAKHFVSMHETEGPV